MSTSKRRLTISLVAHTNVGKTTLARTLLRRDVGEVLDQAHVTEISEAYPLIETDEALLCLWDTPGLGDTVRLVRRLKKEGSPVGWFLHQVWDRQRDRPLWCSQEALRNVREDADVVLYLVNAGESPADAGYVPLELEILNWVGRPTLVVLNQTGGTAEEARRLSDEWRAFLADQPVVRGVLALDAFTRSWVQEDQLFERV
ncbi:MAG: putative GTPase, partial [Gammaproteobacteria bacterium]